MNLSDSRKVLLVTLLTLLLAFMLAVTVVGCAGTSTEQSTEEASGTDECDCEAEDLTFDCKEWCFRRNTP